MPLDAVALKAVAYELNKDLTDARIEKVHQPERDELLLVLKTSNGQKKLAISASSANARIHLVDEVKENPSVPPMFCMLLRKHITGARICSVKCESYERIVEILLQCRNELGDIVMRTIVCEIMGRNSNIIFLDEDRKIIDSVKHIDLTVSSVRNILPGLKYFMPPAGERINPKEAEAEAFLNVLENAPDGREADRAITDAVMGISPLLAGECIFRACGNRNVLIGELKAAQKTVAAKELYELFKRTENNDFSPCIILKEESSQAIDFAPFEINQYGNTARCILKESMNKAASDFYFMRDMRARMQDRSAAITKVVSNNLKRAEKKINILQNEIKEAEDRERYKICGDLITANLYRMKKGDEKLIAQNYYEEDCPDIEIKLDITKSPSQNADKYYTKYKKAKNTEIYAKKQLEITMQEINYLESVLYSATQAQSPSELAEIKRELISAGYIKNEQKKKKKEKTPPMGKPMEFEYKNYTIYVGKNNVQNDYLTMKMGRSRDLWLHAKNIAGSHTLVKYKGEEFPNDVIEKAAGLAAFYSKGKNSPYVEVDYCPVSHVKKPSGAKAGMVIYEGYSTAFVKPLELLVIGETN